jgi:8-oxo-dGTP pyrophosphatase MutT (NUDIX family)
VLVVRTTPSGLEVFMVQRHRKSGFMPSAWVFPGGKVDEGDRLHAHPRVSGKLALTGLSESGATAYGVAAIRETFEEAGIWLGTGEPTARDREALANGEIGMGALLDKIDGGLSLDRLRPWSWWITPIAEPKRFDTRFLIASAGKSTGEQHDGRETVDSRWVSPRAVLADLDSGAAGEFPMAPPTWWTLRELAAHQSAEAAFAAAKNPVVPILPVMHIDDQGFRLLLPGHPDHGAPAIEGLPDRITFDRADPSPVRRWVGWRGPDRWPALPEMG